MNGRTDVAIAYKETFIQALMQFEDGCGSFYSYRGYFLAAGGLAEFPQFSKAETILGQLLNWRFGTATLKQSQRYPTPLREGARVALLQTDRALAISALERSTTDATLQLQAAENLVTFDSTNPVAIAVLKVTRKKSERTSRKHHKSARVRNLEQAIATLEQRLVVKDAVNQRRIAYRLGTLQPGHPQASRILLQLLLSEQSPAHLKRIVENLKEVLLDDQLVEVVSLLKPGVVNKETSVDVDSTQIHECYKLLWHCAQRMTYGSFFSAWSRD